jgi:hypothetical protein
MTLPILSDAAPTDLLWALRQKRRWAHFEHNDLEFPHLVSRGKAHKTKPWVKYRPSQFCVALARLEVRWDPEAKKLSAPGFSPDAFNPRLDDLAKDRLEAHAWGPHDELVATVWPSWLDQLTGSPTLEDFRLEQPYIRNVFCPADAPNDPTRNEYIDGMWLRGVLTAQFDDGFEVGLIPRQKEPHYIRVLGKLTGVDITPGDPIVVQGHWMPALGLVMASTRVWAGTWK